MDISFDQFSGHTDPRNMRLSEGSNSAAGLPALDWSGLIARLAAAHAARHVLSLGRGPVAASGSFAPDIARDLAAWRAAVGRQREMPSSPGVNLDAKADRKPPRTISRIDAGDDRLLVRGLS